jgi:hypothetical protein
MKRTGIQPAMVHLPGKLETSRTRARNTTRASSGRSGERRRAGTDGAADESERGWTAGDQCLDEDGSEDDDRCDLDERDGSPQGGECAELALLIVDAIVVRVRRSPGAAQKGYQGQPDESER